MTDVTDQPRRAAVMSLDGTRIDYEQWGSGPALVLVHGGLVDRSFWGPSLLLLAQHYTVYALDRRGHGHSSPYPADHDIEREYEDVAAMVMAVGAPVAVLGHSGGARVALHAARRADQVRRLNPELFPSARAQVLAGMRELPVWAAALRNVRSIPAEADSYATYRFEPVEFRDFTTPTVLLLGSTSSPVMRGFVEDLCAALPNSRIMMLEGEGHGANLTAPELFVRTVRAALDWAQDP